MLRHCIREGGQDVPSNKDVTSLDWNVGSWSPVHIHPLLFYYYSVVNSRLSLLSVIFPSNRAMGLSWQQARMMDLPGYGQRMVCPPPFRHWCCFLGHTVYVIVIVKDGTSEKFLKNLFSQKWLFSFRKSGKHLGAAQRAHICTQVEQEGELHSQCWCR